MEPASLTQRLMHPPSKVLHRAGQRQIPPTLSLASRLEWKSLLRGACGPPGMDDAFQWRRHLPGDPYCEKQNNMCCGVGLAR